jgi:predicted metalloprotease with PDZ domain
MKTKYFVQIAKPENHFVKVKLQLAAIEGDTLEFFLPSWSPGSYLMREYSKHLRNLYITDLSGNFLTYTKKTKNSWVIENLKEGCEISYEIYCHELTVRTSHVDSTHAFLHGPSFLIGTSGITNPEISFKFPGEWNKITTGLTPAGSKDQFSFIAKDYDQLLDSPIEIGNQETDGFLVNKIPHYLCFYGKQFPHENNLKKDIQKIVEYIADYMGEIPYEAYTFITHFAPNHFGGLEHLNSTALGFDGRKLNNKKMYLRFLSLVAHEYFHTWNVKRIRPQELGPFNYTQENFTSMLWLAEGLTSFLDNYFVYKIGLCSEQDYWDLICEDLNKYYQTPGRKFDSLEMSSFDAWIKLYMPNENSMNSSISYYLKGGLVFLALDFKLREIGSSTKELVSKLWQDFKNRPEKGINKEQFLELLHEDLQDWFLKAIETTEDLDFEAIVSPYAKFHWEDPKVSWGANFDSSQEILKVASVTLDGSAHKSGLNVGDEILAINDQRVYGNEFNETADFFMENRNYQLLVGRTGQIIKIDFLFEKSLKQLKKIESLNKSF